MSKRKKICSLVLAATLAGSALTPTYAQTSILSQVHMAGKGILETGQAQVSRFDTYYSSYREAYDAMFKMDNDNIESVVTNGGHLNWYSTIANMTDGKLETYWETAKQNSENFTNEIVFTFKQETVLNRMAYRSAFNTVGFAEAFEIWASDTAEGENFRLVSEGTATKTADVVELRFEPTQFKRLKFVFKKCYNNKATASEVMFYKEDALLDEVKGLFTDASFSQVSEDFNSLQAIEALETKLSSHPLYPEYKQTLEDAKALVRRGEVKAVLAKVSAFGVSEDKLAAYDERFKITREEIIKASNTGGTSNQTKIENVLDNNLATFWESGKVNSGDYYNEVEFEFDTIKTLNRIVYATRRGMSRGFAEAFEIYASPTSVGDTFELIATGEAEVTQDRVEIRFEPTEIKRIKFVYKKSVDSWAAASEFGFYEQDVLKDQVQDLFTDATLSQVSAEFDTVDKIDALEKAFESHLLYEDYKEYFDNARILVSRGEIEVSQVKVSKFEPYYSEERAAYDEAFKMNNDNIVSVVANGGHLNWYSTIENMTDGKLGTYWETAKQNSDSFTNELTFTFKEEKELNRIAYASASNTVGFAEEFEIWGSTTTKGETFQLVATGTANKTKDVVEFKFAPTKFKRLKFVFKNCYSNKATVSEIMFYGQDAVSEKVETLFTDQTHSQVAEAFRDLEKLSALEQEIKNHPFEKDLQAQIDLAKQIVQGQADFSKNIFVLEQHGNIVNHVRNNLKMGSFGTNLQPTGIVAKPGEVFKVYVEAEEGKPLPKIAFTQQEGHYGNWIRTYELQQGVNTIVVPEIYSESWSMKSAKGGAVYLVNPYTKEEQGKAPVVRIEGGEHFPFFNEGDDVEAFLEELAAYKQKLEQNPETTVDIFEFNAYRLIFTGRTTEAYKVYIEEGVDVNESVNVWDDQFELALKFAGLSDNNPDVKHDSTNIKTPVRLMQPFGSAYAAGDHIGLQRKVMDYFLRTDKASVNDIIWGTIHELGHQMDIPARTWAEVTNNMWANYASILNGKSDRINYETLYKTLAPQDSKRGSEGLVLEMFWQLQLANENYWPDLESMYRDNNPKVTDEQNKKDTLALYSSKVMGMNLTPYFEKYNFNLSEACKAELAELPTMDKKLWYVNTSAMGYTGNGFNDEVQVEITSIKNTSDKGTTLTFKIDAANQDDLLGYEILRDGKVIGFTSQSTFTDADAQESENYDYTVVAYARDLSYAEGVSIQSQTPVLSVVPKITLQLNQDFNPLDYASAFDSMGNAIEGTQATHNVDTTETGIYEVTYEVNHGGIKAQKKAVVEVVGEYVYLSDINWESAKTEYGTVRKDKASTNNTLKLLVDGKVKEFAKGIGTHATSEIIYNLEGENYETFETYVGVDRNIVDQNTSSVIFKIYADDVEVYNSGLMKYHTEAQFVSIPLEGVQTLKLVAHNADNGNGYDHTDFADAKFIMSEKVIVIDKAELEALLETPFEGLNPLHYHKEALEAYEAVVEAGKVLLEAEDITQEEVDEMVAHIQDAKAQLIVRENKVLLEQKIKEAELEEDKGYEAIRWNNFLWAIDYAKGIYNNLEATDEEINAALFTLDYMRNELK